MTEKHLTDGLGALPKQAFMGGLPKSFWSAPRPAQKPHRSDRMFEAGSIWFLRKA